jgi:hypothetical protein
MPEGLVSGELFLSIPIILTSPHHFPPFLASLPAPGPGINYSVGRTINYSVDDQLFCGARGSGIVGRAADQEL